MTGKLLILHIVFSIIAATQVNAGEVFTASVRKIIDGDSFIVSTARHKTIEVRLYGVDCPEYDQPFSKDAKQFTEKRVFGKRVEIEPMYHDKYGRLVAIVVCDDKIINYELVQAGLAWVSPRYCKKSFCESWEEIERKAHRERKGLWHHSHPVSPWDWKKMRKTDRTEVSHEPVDWNSLAADFIQIQQYRTMSY